MRPAKSTVTIACAASIIVMSFGCAKSESETAAPDSSSVADTSATTPDRKASVAEPKAAAVSLEPLPDPAGDNGTYTISQVMKFAHDNRLFRKLFSVPVDPAVAERIGVLYESLEKQDSPKGDSEDWSKRVTALLESAKRVVDGDETAIGDYKKAVNCSSCHSRHRD